MTVEELKTILNRKYTKSTERQAEFADSDYLEDREVEYWHNGYQVALSEILELLTPKPQEEN